MGRAERAGGPGCDLSSLLHLGSRDHERWSIQRLVLAVTEEEVSQKEVLSSGLAGRDVVCWCPGYWRELPDECCRGSRAACLFYHTDQGVLAHPDLVAGICLNRAMQRELRAVCPDKPVYVARLGGVEAARPHARREHPTGKIRLLVTGMAEAPLIYDHDRGRPEESYPLRKSPELILPLAERLDPARYAWVFTGTDWGPCVEALLARGWTVIHPGAVRSPLHYRYFGEADIYLMLSRLEGGPLPLLETMGLGVWPICTPTGIAPEVVRHGRNGYLLPAYDGANGERVVEETAALIETLDGERLREAGGRVRESVADRTWPDFKRDVERILGRIFAG